MYRFLRLFILGISCFATVHGKYVYDRGVATDRTSQVLEKLPPRTIPQNQHTHEYIKRWLHETNGNVDDAVKMIEKHVSWRKRMFPITKTSMLHDSFNQARAFMPLGRAKDGSYIMYIRSGLIPIDTMNLDNVVQLFVSTLEHVLAHDKGNQLPQFTILYDRTDFSIRKNFKKAFYKRLIRVLTENYPGTLRAIYVHPTDWVLSTLWKVIKLFMNPETAGKVKMIKHEQKLQHYIDIKHLPQSLGGQVNIDDFTMEKYFQNEPKQIKDRWLS
jgi:hypothetical protein